VSATCRYVSVTWSGLESTNYHDTMSQETRKPSTEVSPITLAAFSPVTLTFKLDLYNVEANQYAKYLGQTSFTSKLLSGHTDKHTHWTKCSTWTTIMVGNHKRMTRLGWWQARWRWRRRRTSDQRGCDKLRTDHHQERWSRHLRPTS